MSKDIYEISDKQAYIDFKKALLEDSSSIIKVYDNIIESKNYKYEISEEYLDLLELVKKDEFNIDHFSTGQVENSGYIFRTF